MPHSPLGRSGHARNPIGASPLLQIFEAVSNVALKPDERRPFSSNARLLKPGAGNAEDVGSFLRPHEGLRDVHRYSVMTRWNQPSQLSQRGVGLTRPVSRGVPRRNVVGTMRDLSHSGPRTAMVDNPALCRGGGQPRVHWPGLATFGGGADAYRYGNSLTCILCRSSARISTSFSPAR